MSVNRELQFLAMLEGHLVKELLDIMSIIFLLLLVFQRKPVYQPNSAFGKSATNLQPQ